MKRVALVARVVIVTLTLVEGAAAQSSSQAQVNAATAAQETPGPPASAAQGQTAPAQPATAAPAGSAETGRKLFASFGCYQCHGYEAQGSTATGPRLGPRPISYAAFSRYVRQPAGQMPPYTTRIVADTDLAHIYAFLQALPEPPTAQSIPLLK